MSLADLSTYATEHLRGHLGHGQLLSAETYQRLHTPRLHQYAYGWGILTPTEQTPYTIYWHNGSNTLWYALVVFIPERNMVVAVTANDGDLTTAEDVAWQIVDYAANDYPKLSPFTAIRWQDTQPEVRIAPTKFASAECDGEWFKLVSINDLPTADIVAFSQNTYGDKWQTLRRRPRRTPHPHGPSAPGQGHPRRRDAHRAARNPHLDIPLTTANRRAIRDRPSPGRVPTRSISFLRSAWERTTQTLRVYAAAGGSLRHSNIAPSNRHR